MPPIGPTIMPAVAPIAPPAVTPSAVAPPISPGQLLFAFARLDARPGEFGDRLANGGEPFGDPRGRRRQRVRRMFTGITRRGGAEEQQDTQRTGGNHVGQDAEIFRTKRHQVPLSCFAIPDREGSQTNPKLVMETLPIPSICVVKVLGRSPKAVCIRGFGQRLGSRSRGRLADSRCSSEIRRQSACR